MKTADFDYALPDELIAQEPMDSRCSSRLLCLQGDSGSVDHKYFSDVLDLCQPGDLLVMNDTRVMAARLYGAKHTGGRVEILLERLLPGGHLLAQIKASKSPKPGMTIRLDARNSTISDYILTVEGRQGDFFELSTSADIDQLMGDCGHMPLPPYIERDDSEADLERYQTVYARNSGAVAAPTAGLHFDQALLDALAAKGVQFGYVTLHVGAGTYQPVRVEDPAEHVMHKEFIHVSDAVCEQVAATRAAGGRIIAVGTTSVRCLETAAYSGKLCPFAGDTQLFITPGVLFNVVDVLITNFHLPKSTLLMLVSAFAGRDATLAAYNQAINERYRFFSYGDAMWITPAEGVRT